MGSSSSQPTQQQFQKSWQLVDKVSQVSIWQHKYNPNYQFQQYVLKQPDHPQAKQLYQLRNSSPFLVHAHSLAQDSTCGNNHSNELFIEKIRIRLSNLQDLPFPDILHLYDVTLQGYSQLANVVGYFNIDEEQIGINEHQQARVWLNTAYNSNQILGNQNISESQMILQLLQILNDCTDKESLPANAPNLAQFIGQSAASPTFSSAKQQFFNYVKQYNNGQVPLSLSCISNHGGTNSIQQWCRNNNGFGYNANSMRLDQHVEMHKSMKSNIYRSSKPAVVTNSQVVEEIKVVRDVQNVQVVQKEREVVVPTSIVEVPPAIDNKVNQTIINHSHRPQAHVYHHPIQKAQQIVNNIHPHNLHHTHHTHHAHHHPTSTHHHVLKQQNINAPPVQPQQIVLPNNVRYIESFPIEQYQINQANVEIPQAESRLQQQRVISEAITIKQTTPKQSTINTLVREQPRILQTDAKSSMVMQWQDYTKSQLDQQKSIIDYAKPTASYSEYPSQQTSEQKTYNYVSYSVEDGKSSPQLLALLASIKNTNQDYQENNNWSNYGRDYVGSPHYQKYQSAYESTKNQYLAQSDSLEGKKFNYHQSNKYESYLTEIDPELQSDLLRYKQ